MDHATLNDLIASFLHHDVSPAGVIQALLEAKYGKGFVPWRVTVTDVRLESPVADTPLPRPRTDMTTDELLRAFEAAGEQARKAAAILEELSQLSKMRRVTQSGTRVTA